MTGRGGRQAARRGRRAGRPTGAYSGEAFAKRIAQAATVLDTAADRGAPRRRSTKLLSRRSSGRFRSPPSPTAPRPGPRSSLDGSLPGERSVERVARRLRMEGANAVRSELLLRFDDAARDGSATTAHLDVRRDAVVVDVTHTVSHSWTYRRSRGSFVGPSAMARSRVAHRSRPVRPVFGLAPASRAE